MTTSLTVSIWARWNTAQAGWKIYIHREATGVGSGDLWGLGIDTSDDYAFFLTTNGVTDFLAPTDAAADIGKWVHLVGTYDGAAMRMYRNGVQVGSMAKTGPIPARTIRYRWRRNPMTTARLTPPPPMSRLTTPAFITAP